MTKTLQRKRDRQDFTGEREPDMAETLQKYFSDSRVKVRIITLNMIV